MNFYHSEISIDDDFVSSEWIYSIIIYSNTRGLKADRLFKRVGIHPSIAVDRNDVITVRQLDMVLQALRTEVGFKSESNSMQTLAQMSKLISELMVTADNVKMAFEKLILYRTLVHPFLQFEIEDRPVNDEVVFTMKTPTKSVLANHPLYFEMFSGMLLAIADILVGKKLKLRYIKTTEAESEFVASLAEKFGLTVYYGAEQSEICFGNNFLNIPLLGALPEYHEKIERKVKQRIAEWPKRASYKSRVLELLDDSVGNELVDMGFICDEMGLNRRTLQRKLKIEGVRFQELLDSARYRYSQSLLKSSEVDIVEISTRLGYSEPSAFYQAFKRWSGLSPGDFRSSHKMAAID